MGERFRGIGSLLVGPNSYLPSHLKQAGIDTSAQAYAGLAIFTATVYGVLVSALVTAMSYRYGVPLEIGPSLGLIVFVATLLLVFHYPRLVVINIAKSTDREMLAAMRHLMIEVRSGVPLFQAMIGLTKGYGQVSVEFDTIVKDINAGTKEIDALNRAAERNTSLFFRRAIWQLVNSMRAGSDIGDTMEAITDSFAKMQAVRIRHYGQELNPWTMMYMIIAVIVPSLGITFLVVLSTFSGLAIPPLIFPIIIIGIIVFQYVFMGFIKTKRPNITV